MPKKERGSAQCAGCGVVFQLHTNSGKGEYCSQSCARSHIGKTTIILNRITVPRTKEIERSCPVCDKAFKSWKSNNRKYCSIKCSGKAAGPKSAETKHKNGWYTATNCFSRAKRGYRKDIGLVVRSSWEANYARFLNFLIEHEGKIEKWEYEVDTFWFEKIKRGCRSYKPDFKVFFKDGHIEYHEVKGWMYPRAKTALKRMRIYHPEVQVVLIDQTSYKAIERQVGSTIKHWELPTKSRKKKLPRKSKKKRS